MRHSLLSDAFQNSSYETANSILAQPFHCSTDAPANVFDDLYVRFQSSGRILASPCDTAFGRNGSIERPEHHILVLELLDLFRHESNTQSCGYGVNHSSFKIDIV